MDKKHYNKKYLISFYEACEKVKEELKKEYPSLTISFYIEEDKRKIIKKAIKVLPSRYNNMYAMLLDFEQLIVKKRKTMLNYLSNMIEKYNIYSTLDYSGASNYEIMKAYYYLLNKYIFRQFDSPYMLDKIKENVNQLKSLCLNIYGISTLVINQQNLYNNYFLKENPRDYNLKVWIKDNYLKYINEEKRLRLAILDQEIKIFTYNEQLKKCTNEIGIQIINRNLNKANFDKQELENQLNLLTYKMKFEPFIDISSIDFEKAQELAKKIEEYEDKFYLARTKEEKIKLKKEISELITYQIELNSAFVYGYCNNMNDTLTIIRDCFSHIGRIYID